MGDLPGHPFRGNQWGEGGAASPKELKALGYNFARQQAAREGVQFTRTTEELTEAPKTDAEKIHREHLAGHEDAIKEYASEKTTAGSSRKMNADLQREPGKLSPEAARLQALITSAPPLPDDTVVYRGLYGVKGQWSKFVPGAELQFDGFQSASFSRTAASDFGEGVLLRISSPKGLAFGDLSAKHPHSGRDEREVLLPHGSKFQVVGTRVNEKGQTWIDLRQL